MVSYFSPVANHVCGGVARRTGHGADVSKAHLGRAGTGRCAAGAALAIRPARTLLGGAGPGRLGDAARDWALTDGRFGPPSEKRWGLGGARPHATNLGTPPQPPGGPVPASGARALLLGSPRLQSSGPRIPDGCLEIGVCWGTATYLVSSPQTLGPRARRQPRANLGASWVRGGGPGRGCVGGEVSVEGAEGRREPGLPENRLRCHCPEAALWPKG